MNNKTHILDSEETLQIIKEIEFNPQITQRLLSQKLEISLGKINFFIVLSPYNKVYKREDFY